MEDALTVHRLHFAFTITFHYIFPQLTMGLALLIFILKTLALKTKNEHWNRCAQFWGKIFGISFALGVVTGFPMEFQFGTNWSQFSKTCGRRDRPDAGDGRRVFIFPRIVISRHVSFWRKETGRARSLVFFLDDVGRARGSQAISSSPPTRGCSIPSATR